MHIALFSAMVGCACTMRNIVTSSSFSIYESAYACVYVCVCVYDGSSSIYRNVALCGEVRYMSACAGYRVT